MSHITNRQTIDLIARQQIFKTGNKTIFSDLVNGAYVVYSYGRHFPMAVFKNGNWYVNEDKYSRTTTAHQSYVRQAIARTGYKTQDGFNWYPKDTRSLERVIYS